MDSLPLNIVDIAVIVALVLSGLLAFMRGLVHEVLSVGAWVGAAVVTLYGFPEAQPIARDFIPIELAADITAGVVIFLVALILFSIISRALAQKVQQSSMGALDRSLGLLFGVARGALIVVVAWMFMAWLLPPDDRPTWITEAKSRPWIERGATLVQQVVPESIRLEGERAAEAAKETTEDAIDAGEKLNIIPDQPEPAAPQEDTNNGASDDEHGYKTDERGSVDQLIESVTQEEQQPQE